MTIFFKNDHYFTKMTIILQKRSFFTKMTSPTENKRKLFGTNFFGGTKYCEHPDKIGKNIQIISLI